MLLEAVTVSINTSSELEYGIMNRDLFDRWVVVTVEEDAETIALCEKHDIEMVFSKRVHEDGARFAKGKIINEGFDALSKEDWLLMIDADIVLPKNFREIAQRLPRDEESLSSIYCPRFRRMLGSPSGNYDEYCALKVENIQEIYNLYYKYFKDNIDNNLALTFEQHHSFYHEIRDKGLSESKTPSGEEQWEAFHSGNWDIIPINFEGHHKLHLGYFQLFHASSFAGYAEVSHDANWDDILFKYQYDDSKRKVINFDCVHIGGNSYNKQREKDTNEEEIFALPPGIKPEQVKADSLFNFLDEAAYVRLD